MWVQSLITRGRGAHLYPYVGGGGETEGVLVGLHRYSVPISISDIETTLAFYAIPCLEKIIENGYKNN